MEEGRDQQKIVETLRQLLELKKSLESLRQKRAALELLRSRIMDPPGPPYVAVILEPRKHRALTFVVRNILENLNSDWTVLIYHGTGNEEWLKGKLSGELSGFAERIAIRNLGVENLPTSRSYSEILMSRKFTEEIPGEIFLVFQTDSMINSKFKDTLAKFMKYDYVGAPWPWQHLQVGNGGFSLRRKRAMLEIIDKAPKYWGENEDQFFSVGCQAFRPYKPSAEESREFSVEQIFHAESFGIHKAWVHMPDRVEDLCAAFEGLRTLIELQGLE